MDNEFTESLSDFIYDNFNGWPSDSKVEEYVRTLAPFIQSLSDRQKAELEQKYQGELRGIIDLVLPKAKKFVDKVESGRARSRETYADMKEIIEQIESTPNKPSQPDGSLGVETILDAIS